MRKWLKTFALAGCTGVLGIALAQVLIWQMVSKPAVYQQWQMAQEQVQALGQLVLEQYHYRSLIYIKNPVKWLGVPVAPLLAGQELLLAVPYRVRVGVDLSQDGQMRRQGKKVYFSYRGARVLSVEAQHAETETFFSKSGFLTPVTMQDFLPALDQEKEKVAQEVGQALLQTHVNQQFEAFMRDFLGKLGYDQIDFEVLT